VLDAGAFYAGIPFLSSGSHCTTEAVFAEVKHIKRSHAAIDVLVDLGKLRIIEPDQSDVEKVVEVAKKTGDSAKLSEADTSILALALSVKKTLVTGDYAVANVANVMKIPVRSTSSKGIYEVRRWITYCSACSRTFGPNTNECLLCGNKLRRKYKKSA
jgi:endoribonuclease Nob1